MSAAITPASTPQQIANLADMTAAMSKLLMAMDDLIPAGFTVLGFRAGDDGPVITCAQPADECVDRLAKSINGVDFVWGSLMWFHHTTAVGTVTVQWYERRVRPTQPQPLRAEVH